MAEENTNVLKECTKAAEMVGFSLTAAIGFVLNAMVIISVLYIRRPYICTKIALHLSLSNIFGCIFVILFHGLGDSWLLEHNACTPFLVFKSFWFASATLMTSFLVYEGFFKVKHRLKLVNAGGDIERENCLNFKFTLCLLWVSSLTIALLTLFLIDISEQSLCLSYQHTRKSLVRFYYGFIIVLPLLLLLLLYVYFKRLSIKHRQSVGVSEREAPHRIIQRDLHYAKSSFKASHMLILTWFPHTMYMFCLIDWFIDNILFNEITYHVLKFLQWLCYLSCLAQPLVIIITNYQVKIMVLAKMKSIWYSICGDPAGNMVFENEESAITSSTDFEKSASTNNEQDRAGSSLVSSTTVESHIQPARDYVVEDRADGHNHRSSGRDTSSYSPTKQIITFHKSPSDEEEDIGNSNKDLVSYEYPSNNYFQSDHRMDDKIDDDTRIPSAFREIRSVSNYNIVDDNNDKERSASCDDADRTSSVVGDNGVDEDEDEEALRVEYNKMRSAGSFNNTSHVGNWRETTPTYEQGRVDEEGRLPDEFLASKSEHNFNNWDGIGVFHDGDYQDHSSAKYIVHEDVACEVRRSSLNTSKMFRFQDDNMNDVHTTSEI